MKRLFLLLFIASSAHAVVTINGAEVIVGTVTIQGASPILSTGTLQSGTTIYISSAAIINELNLGGFSGNGFQLDPSTWTFFSSGTNVPYVRMIFSSSNIGGNLHGLSLASGDGTKRINLDPTLGGFFAVNTNVQLSSTTMTGYFQFATATSAQLNAKTPTTGGQTWYCSDCATVPVCISTGTTMGAFSLITNKTASCQ